MQVPHSDVSVTTTAEADFAVGTDGESVASRSTGR